jgi:hypothetical protein
MLLTKCPAELMYTLKTIESRPHLYSVERGWIEGSIANKQCNAFLPYLICKYVRTKYRAVDHGASLGPLQPKTARWFGGSIRGPMVSSTIENCGANELHF